MTDDGGNFMPHPDDDYTPNRPRPRKPERVGQPRASRQDDMDAAMDRIVRDIMERDRVRFPREREQARRRLEG